MTVQRYSEDQFDAPPLDVATAVRTILARCPPYIESSESEKDLIFKTNVKPFRGLLRTNMTVRLQPSFGGTRVLAETRSQWFIMGDVFDMYNRYIRDFLRDLHTELQKQKT
jgi:hypothetical protein